MAKKVSNQCRYCGATIRWVRTMKGAWQALEPHPDPSGNIVVTGAGPESLGMVVKPGEAGTRFLPHAAVCRR